MIVGGRRDWKEGEIYIQRGVRTEYGDIVLSIYVLSEVS